MLLCGRAQGPYQRGHPAAAPHRASSLLVPSLLLGSLTGTCDPQAIATGNHYSNTKYILNALNLHASPTPPSRERNRELKLAMNKARSYAEMGAAFGVGADEVEELQAADEGAIEAMLPVWSERRKAIVEAEGVP